MPDNCIARESEAKENRIVPSIYCSDKYGVYERSSDGFAERYLAMLAAGGSKSYSELLAPFGLDARDPGFWKIGLSVIERMIDELQAMA
jgi:oligoendopeptidase F